MMKNRQILKSCHFHFVNCIYSPNLLEIPSLVSFGAWLLSDSKTSLLKFVSGSTGGYNASGCFLKMI